MASDVPLAMCPGCKAPLIGTMHVPKEEFYCLECGRSWGFLQPDKGGSEEDQARYQNLQAEWDEHVAGRLLIPRSYHRDCNKCSPARSVYHSDHATEDEIQADFDARVWLAERVGATV